MALLFVQAPLAFVAVALLLGLLVGSFLNVVIYRLPIMLEREWRAECATLASDEAHTRTLPAALAGADAGPAFNLVTPRSACPHCQAPIRAWQNIPVLSWLWLGGKCASCRAPISGRYPVVELVTGLLTAAVAWKFGFGWTAACGMLLTWFLVALTGIDLDHKLLPDTLTLPLMWLGLLASVAGLAAPGVVLPVTPPQSILGAAIGYGSLWSVYQLFRLITGKEGMGYGDFKLLAALGAWLGVGLLLPVVLISATVGALTGVLLILTGRQARGQTMPFGPYLAAAGWIALMWGPELVTGYLGYFHPVR
ncbi:MAG TPA: A24 family peptidase [Steroidobacteraceae bacterium]|nr:A24 family peptidase [Steroidobacteraceae bacterium]